ncbi:hypothetical protein PhCBS80983_g03711 [Powellomyces hirtus]|uniref:Uncharacterized protein n=1 Tax=Powellomyces hirtus TaxID=109895 RepID=A0A507E0R7_9FUNG|nr:hypothetical protein PhCBS80983_g03711 [Powellomyces hirtus]
MADELSDAEDDFSGGPVAWQSKRQPTVALSRALPCKIYEDNQGCIALARNPTSHARTKHIDIRHHFIREAIANQHVDLEYCPTKDVAADLLTKSLPSPQFAKLCEVLDLGIKSVV